MAKDTKKQNSGEDSKELEEGDVVLGKVERIQNTTVFVDIEDDGKGTIITSEVAPGRIRNLRDYVVPGKKIACKVLEVDDSGTVHLSLRRVTDKEKQKVMDQYERRKSTVKILESVLDNPEPVIEKIREEYDKVYDFLQKAREDPEMLEEYVNKKEAEKILEILKKRKSKKVEVKAEFKLSTDRGGGLDMIKAILKPHQDSIKYQSAGRYIIKIKADNYKKANKERDKILEDIENKAKEKGLEVSVEEK